MVNSASPQSDFDSYGSQELLRDLTQELRRRDSDDGQALASTSQLSPSKLENDLKRLLLCCSKPKRKRNTDESVQMQMAPATSSEGSHCSTHVPAMPRTKRKPIENTIVTEISSDHQHPDKPAQRDLPRTSAANQESVARNGTAASPSVGCATTAGEKPAITTGEKPKRKRIRKSKKPPTTVVLAEVSEFRAKVQELTGQKHRPYSDTISDNPPQRRDRECLQPRLVRPAPHRHNASAPVPQSMDLDARDVTARVPSDLVQGHSLPSTRETDQVAAVDHKPAMHATITWEEPQSSLNYTMGYPGSLAMETFLLESTDVEEALFMVSEDEYSHKLFSEVGPQLSLDEQPMLQEDEDIMRFFADATR